MSAPDVLRQAADIFEERRAVYGDNFKKVGGVLSALFPQGIELRTADDHNRFHILMLQIVKITRYSENWGRGGHDDSLIDLAVYASMLLSIDREIIDREIQGRPEVPF